MKLSRQDFINSPPEIKDDLLGLFNQSDPLQIFDIGACEGEDAVRYSKLFHNSTVFLFEPRPDNLKKVEENISKYNCTNIRVSDLALSNENGNATFYLSSGQPDLENKPEDWDFGNKSSSLLPPSEEMKKHTEWLEFKETLEVTTKRLDEFCNANKVEQIDFIHMDVQGAELMVLEGAGSFINKIAAIWLEVEAVELYKGQPLKNDIELFMEKNGFIRIKSTVNNIAGDQLYANPALIDRKKIDALIAANAKAARIKKIKHYYYSLRNMLSGKK